MDLVKEHINPSICKENMWLGRTNKGTYIVLDGWDKYRHLVVGDGYFGGYHRISLCCVKYHKTSKEYLYDDYHHTLPIKLLNTDIEKIWEKYRFILPIYGGMIEDEDVAFCIIDEQSDDDDFPGDYVTPTFRICKEHLDDLMKGVVG